MRTPELVLLLAGIIGLGLFALLGYCLVGAA